jgi:hypothetical protein
MSDQPPLPAQVLEYESIVDNPWPGVMRILGMCGLLYSAAIVAIGLLWLLRFTPASSGQEIGWSIMIKSDLRFSLVAIPILVGSVRYLRFRCPGRSLAWGCWTLIVVFTADLLSNLFSLWGMANPDFSFMLRYVAGLAGRDLAMAALPLLLALLTRHLLRIPQFRATLAKCT